jgi:hypothetical protein
LAGLFIGLSVIALICICSIVFAKKLGSFTRYTRTEFFKIFSKSGKPVDPRLEWMKLTFFDFGLSITPNFDVWFFRIWGFFGIALIITSLIIIFFV